MDVIIATVPWRRASLERLLRELAAQTRVPDRVVVILDGYGEAELAPRVPAGLAVEFVASSPTQGQGRRWIIAVEWTAPPEFLLSIDDDVSIDPRYVAEMVAAVRATKGAVACGGRTLDNRFVSSGLHEAFVDQDTHYLETGTLALPWSYLRGIGNYGELGKRLLTKGGHDEALVSAHLWRNGRRLRMIHRPFRFDPCAFDDRSMHKTRDAESMRLAAERELGWHWEVRPKLPRVSVVLPWSTGCAHREAAWKFIRAMYEARFPDWEIITVPCGNDVASFTRSAALLYGGRKASGSVLVFSDADVWTDGIAEAVARVAEGGGWIDPANCTIRMDEATTAEVLAGRRRLADLPVDGGRKVPCGGVFVFSRAAFEKCPPDVRFRGWGGDDDAQEHALVTLVGPHVQVAAPLWHFYHPRTEPHQAQHRAAEHNLRLLDRYLAARGNAVAMRHLIDETRLAEVEADAARQG